MEENKVAKKVIQGLILGAIFAVIGYAVFKEIGPALVWGMIMFMSMFVKKNN